MQPLARDQLAGGFRPDTTFDESLKDGTDRLRIPNLRRHNPWKDLKPVCPVLRS